MAAFDKAVSFVLDLEGGLSDDPADPGGLTKYGISRKAYPDLDIASLTLRQAKKIYRDDYWRACRCDALPTPVAFAVFDAAVNQGVRTATKTLQKVLRVRQDGAIGPLTLAAARDADPASFVRDYLARRAERYAKLRTFSRFGYGWMRRLFGVHQEAMLAAVDEAVRGRPTGQ